MNSRDTYKLVSRAYDYRAKKYIPKFDVIITSGPQSRLEAIKLLLEELDEGIMSFTRRVEYRQSSFLKEYFVMKWHDKLPESKETDHDHP